MGQGLVYPDRLLLMDENTRTNGNYQSFKTRVRKVLPVLRIAFWFFVAVFFGIERFVDEESRSYRASVGMFLIATCGTAVIFLIALALGVLFERWSLRSSQAGSPEHSDKQPDDA